MTGDTADTGRRLHDVERSIAANTVEMRRLEGECDRMIMAAADNVGAHDRRPVAVR